MPSSQALVSESELQIGSGVNLLKGRTGSPPGEFFLAPSGTKIPVTSRDITVKAVTRSAVSSLPKPCRQHLRLRHHRPYSQCRNRSACHYRRGERRSREHGHRPIAGQPAQHGRLQQAAFRRMSKPSSPCRPSRQNLAPLISSPPTPSKKLTFRKPPGTLLRADQNESRATDLYLSNIASCQPGSGACRLG